MSKVLIIGATSAIAQSTARLFAQAGDSLFLVGRDRDKVDAVANDLRVRGATEVFTAVLDLLNYDQHRPTIDAAVNALHGLDIALIAHGTLPDQRACEESGESLRREFAVNATSTLSILMILANYFEETRRGTIAVISSVAGDRGRQSNYVYGASKGAVTVFLQGLRNRLHFSGVSVVTIKPGFVDTPMTAAFAKNALWSSAERAATDIHRAIIRRKDVAYVPFFWRYVMLILRALPEALMKRLRL